MQLNGNANQRLNDQKLHFPLDPVQIGSDFFSIFNLIPEPFLLVAMAHTQRTRTPIDSIHFSQRKPCTPQRGVTLNERTGQLMI